MLPMLLTAVSPLVALAGGASAGAYDFDAHASLRLDARTLWTQPEPETNPDANPESGTDAAADAPAIQPAGGFWRNTGPYLEEDSTFLTVGAGLGFAGNEATDYQLYAAWSKFIVDDVELVLELGAFYFDQEGDNALGLSPVALLRWHVWSSEPEPGLDPAWTVFADIGIGFYASTSDVPAGGTSFNARPRADIGFTRRLTDGGVRLQAGIGWHHISNGRIEGQDNNPARDSILAFAGLVFPF